MSRRGFALVSTFLFCLFSIVVMSDLNTETKSSEKSADSSRTIPLTGWQAPKGPYGRGSYSFQAIDPCNADSIYVGGSVLYHSSDSGKKYEKVTGFSEVKPRLISLFSIAISRDADGPMIITGDSNYHIVSNDRGKTWQCIEAPRGEIYAGPKSSKVFYLVNMAVLRRSKDDGKTWSICRGVPGIDYIRYFICDRTDADTVFLMYNVNNKETYCLSRDGGDTFKDVSLPAGEGFINSASLDPDDKKILYVATINFSRGEAFQQKYFFSYDDGKTWEVYYDPFAGEKIPANIAKKLNYCFPYSIETSPPTKRHMSYERKAFAWSENIPGRIILRGSDDKLYLSNDFGKNWQESITGLAATSVRHLVLDPNNAGSAFCASVFDLWHTSDGGKNWDDMSLNFRFFIYDVKYSPWAENAFVVSDNIWKASANGKDWGKVYRFNDTKQIPGVLFFEKVEDENNQIVEKIFLLGNKYLLASLDGGSNWQKVCDTECKLRDGMIITTDRVKTGTVNRWFIRNYGTMLSDDFGCTWKNAQDEYQFSPISFCAGADDVIWMLGLNSIYISDTPPIKTPLELMKTKDYAVSPRCIACDPKDPKTGYIGLNDGGILRTTDRAKTLLKLEGGPKGIPVQCLAVSPHDGSLWVGTDGNGVWILTDPKNHPVEDVEKNGEEKTEK